MVYRATLAAAYPGPGSVHDLKAYAVAKHYTQPTFPDYDPQGRRMVEHGVTVTRGKLDRSAAHGSVMVALAFPGRSLLAWHNVDRMVAAVAYVEPHDMG